VTRNARGPSSQAAGTRVGAPRQCYDDLLERCLHEIVMVRFASAKNAVQCVIDDTGQALVDHGSYLMVAALNGCDQFFVRGLTAQRSLTRPGARG